MRRCGTQVSRVQPLAETADVPYDNVLVIALFKPFDARAPSTYNIRPTYYYNVWGVELSEYVEPQQMQLNHSIALATQLYSAAQQEPVWGIESETKLSMDYDERGDVSVITRKAKAITSYLSRDGLLAP